MRTKLLFFILFLFTFTLQDIFSYSYVQFEARRINSYDRWYVLEFNEFENKIIVDGLFYETTLTMKVRLGKEYRWSNGNYQLRDPYSGNYEFVWNFNLPEKSVITDCKLWDEGKGEYISAQMIDLSTAEENYDPNNTSKQQLLMREYRNRNYNGSLDNFLELKITPVDSREYKKIQIKFLTPCEMFWDVRRFRIHTRNFYNPYSHWNNSDYFPNNDNPAVFKIIDKNHPDEKPRNINNISGDWQKADDYWQWQIGPYVEYPDWGYEAILRVPMEIVDGEYLKTFEDGSNKFYQCSILPNINEEDRTGRHVIIAIDLIRNNSFLDNIKYSLKYGLTSKDSVLFIVSDFNPTWLSNDFEQKSNQLIDQRINETRNYYPKLNTLPFILRTAVNKFNQIDKGGEIWLISDDETHAETAAEAMEIVGQTLFAANNDIKFRILDNGYGSGYFINNKFYTGNQYLYENLFRLSGGSYKRLSEYPHYDWADVGFDVFAPTIGVVEIDPIPQSGFSYSRIDLNNGRKSFNITSRYYQIGLFDGNQPFEILYNGYYDEELYRKTFTVEETTIKNEYDQFVKTYWFAHYIRENLLEQPQTYETIKYIEQLAVENNILTPYSGFLIPGDGNYIGFQALTLDDTLNIGDSIATTIEEIPEVPNNYTLSAYPNPFNPTTTINIEMSNKADKDFVVEIYNILGQKVKTYEFNNNYSATKRIVWNGKNEFGENVSSGTYIVRFVSKHHIQTMKLLLIR
ncbi:MAG: T9SS type A sorting domain-containing protein [Melioribacteraceae bacterium]|nr:T9SS type A sorting domain-containing protein [Melioribacteraceae bacterium]